MGNTATYTFPVPTADTSNTATVNAFEKCYLNGATCDTEGQFPAVSVLFDGTAIPSGWVTYSASGTSSQTMTVTPTDGTAVGVHTITVIYDSINGPNPSYTAIELTVTCEVLTITPPSAPTSDLTYIIYDQTHTIDLSTGSYVYT